MADAKTDVKTVIDPSTITEPKADEKAVVTPPAGDVTPVTPEPAAPVVVKEEPKDDNPMVPRGRLNEEIQKRHELEERLKALEDARNNPPAPVTAPVVPVKDEIESLAEQMSAEAGADDFGNPILPVKAAKVVVMNQLRIQHASTAGSRLDANVSQFIKSNPRAEKYAERIKTELSKLAPGVKDNPVNVQRKYLELVGSDIEEIEREAEERGKKKALEQKRIVPTETPSGVPDGKSPGDMLTADEKKFADNHKISYDDYYKAKGNKRV